MTALRRLGRISPLYPIFTLIFASALALGRYSYRNARAISEQSERSLAESNRTLGEAMLERIDNFIIDSDRALIHIVDLERLKEFSTRWTQIVRLSQAVEAAMVLDDKHRIVRGGYVSRQPEEEQKQFEKLFLTVLLPELKLDELQLDQHRHLHQVVDGKDYLISYIRREQEATAQHPRQTYYVVLKISIEYLLKDFFPHEFEKLLGRELFAILDENGRVIFGEKVRAPRKMLYEGIFPTTLYLWRLQMAPPDAERLAAEAQRRGLYDTGLVIAMVAVLLAGIAFLLYAVRKERVANQLKSEFISNVSHELKTPLSLIRMFGELLAMGKVKSADTGREYAEIITRESERLSHLIDNVLDFSRIERGKQSYDFQRGNLADVVARASDVYRHRFERDGTSLKTDIEDELPDALFDESAMTLVLLNLLDNAVKYGGDKGRIVVGLSRDPSGSRLRLWVKDHGPGIPVDEQRRIFDRFYRAPSARAQSARGSGIGLSLVKAIAEAHGGRVTVESQPGSGATFTVTIPLAGPDKGPRRAGSESESEEAA